MRILVYDATQENLWREKGLSHLWRAGAFVADFDAVIPAENWPDACARLKKYRGEVAHLEVWSHGSSGRPWIDNDWADEADLELLREAIEPDPDCVVWFRACDVFQGRRGQSFAIRATEILGCCVVGHTRVVSQAAPGFFGILAGFLWQSGGYGLRPGEVPQWSAADGGWSAPWKRHTVSIFDRRVPRKWWQPR